MESNTPEQLSAEPPEEDRTMLQLQRIALRARQEARQQLDLRKDLARRAMPSDGAYSLGNKVFAWMKDQSKKKSEGVSFRGKVASQEGAMVLAQVHKSVLRMHQSKVRRDHDPRHDVAMPLNPEPEVKVDDAPEGSHLCGGSGHHCSCCYEHETCYHTYTDRKSDFVEITASLTIDCLYCQIWFLAEVPVLTDQWNMKKVTQSISKAWKTILDNDPEHVIIHPVVPKQWNSKATKAFGSSALMWLDGKITEEVLRPLCTLLRKVSGHHKVAALSCGDTVFILTPSPLTRILDCTPLTVSVVMAAHLIPSLSF